MKSKEIKIKNAKINLVWFLMITSFLTGLTAICVMINNVIYDGNMFIPTTVMAASLIVMGVTKHFDAKYTITGLYCDD